MLRTPAPARPSFLAGDGQVRDLIANYDWSSTSLGPIGQWAAVTKTTVALILQSPVPIVTLWGDLGVMIYNDGYARFAGGRHPQILGADVLDAWPEAADWNRDVMARVFHGGETLSVQDQLLELERHGRAEPVWMNLDYSPIVDDDGAIVGVIAIVVETTGKVRAEQRLSGERERLRGMFDAAPGFIALLEGPEHRFVMANPSYEELVGRPVVGKTVREALPEVADQGFIELLDNVATSGEALSGRAVPVRLGREAEAQEKFVDFVYQPMLGEDGERMGIFVQGYDVTDHKRAEALRIVHNRVLELAIEDRPLEATLESLVRIVEEHSTSGVIASILLLDRDGRHLRHGAAPSLPDAYNDAIDGVEIGPEVGSCGAAAYTGQPVFVTDIASDPKWADFKDLAAAHGLGACWSIPIVSGPGQVLGTFAMYHREPREPVQGDLELVDLITRSASIVISRKQAEAALRELNETLEARVVEEIGERRAAEVALQQAQKMESIGKLTGGVAHDFNNLLQIISGNLQLLQAELPPNNPKSERRITNAMAGVQRGAKLAAQLLAFGRRQPLEPKVVNIGRLVIGMEELLRRSIGEGVEMETVVSPSLWNAFADPTQVENAILNLAINARDAMEGIGKLTVEVKNAHLDHGYSIQNPEVDPGQYVMLAVSDTGSGMSAELIERVFEPFFTTKAEGKGSGLGLSMVYGFAKQSGGHVKIYSEVGEGTTVRLYLPRVLENEDSTVGPDLVEAGGGSETILVVEDDSEVRSTVTELLRELGYKVLTAKDAASAVPILESGVKIDLLFTDVVMPGPVRSPELARKARERIPNIGILFTSGYTEDAIVHGGRLDPGVNLLPKPYSRQALAMRIRDALQRAPQQG